MNLVAKEFVAARDDDDGVLLLSTFAGASQELAEALIVNPYNVHNTSVAIEQALLMSPTEKRERMRLHARNRAVKKCHRWAGIRCCSMAATSGNDSRIMQLMSQQRSTLEAPKRVALK